MLACLRERELKRRCRRPVGARGRDAALGLALSLSIALQTLLAARSFEACAVAWIRDDARDERLLLCGISVDSRVAHAHPRVFVWGGMGLCMCARLFCLLLWAGSNLASNLATHRSAASRFTLTSDAFRGKVPRSSTPSSWPLHFQMFRRCANFEAKAGHRHWHWCLVEQKRTELNVGNQSKYRDVHVGAMWLDCL